MAIEADWLEAWATVGGAAGTFGTLLYAARGLARERRTRAEEIRRLEAEQRAAQVAQARTVMLHDGQVKWAGPDRGSPAAVVYTVSLTNNGSLPVALLVGHAWWEGDDRVRRPAGVRHVHALAAAATEELTWQVAIGDVAEHVEDLTTMAGRFMAYVTFTDVNGHRWRVNLGGLAWRAHELLYEPGPLNFWSRASSSERATAERPQPPAPS